jgi:hypothetical protein
MIQTADEADAVPCAKMPGQGSTASGRARASQGMRWEWSEMACKKCASENLQTLTAELSASSRHVDEVNHPPIYVCQELLVCLDCGFSELVISAPELEQLRKWGPVAS